VDRTGHNTRRSAVLCLSVLLVLGGCVASEELDLRPTPDAGDPNGGNSGSAGATGAGGTTGAAGEGGTTGAGGTTGVAGATGVAGTTGAGGTTGVAGATGVAGTTGSGGGAGPTFTEIYTSILTPNCSGNQCHNPGSQQGITFSSQSKAYTSVHNLVTPGNATGSTFYSVVDSGQMPPGGPKLSSVDLQTIAAWINAGAPNN